MFLLRAVLNILVKNASPRGPMCFSCLLFHLSGLSELLFVLCFIASNGPKNYAYRTCDGKQVVKVKCFTLNFVAPYQLTFDHMKDMAISEQEEHIIVTESRKIRKNLKRRQNCHPQSCTRALLTRECTTLTTTPVDRTDMRNHYINILSSCTIREQLSVCVCVVHIYSL